MANKIHIQRFYDIGACSDGIIQFTRAFGAEVEVTEDNCRAMAGKLNFAFGADRLLTGRQREVYLALADADDARIAPQVEEVKRQVVEAKTIGEIQEALREKDRVMAPLMREREVNQAIWFARAYNTES